MIEQAYLGNVCHATLQDISNRHMEFSKLYVQFVG